MQATDVLDWIGSLVLLRYCNANFIVFSLFFFLLTERLFWTDGLEEGD